MRSERSDTVIKCAWGAFILNSVFVVLGALMKILHYPGANEILVAGLLLIPVTWALIIWDILNNPIRNKPLWMIAVFVSWNVAALVYLLMRDSLLTKQE